MKTLSVRIFTHVLVCLRTAINWGQESASVCLLPYPVRLRNFAGLLKIVLFGASSPLAKAQQPRLTITLEPPSALVSVGSVLAAPDGTIVVNHDGFGGYQDGAIFVLDSTGRLLRRIPAVEIPAKPYPSWLAPVAKAVLPDGSLIVDYVLNYPSTPGFFRLRLDPEGVAVTPGNDAYLPAGPMIVQPDGGLIIAPEGSYPPLLRLIQETQGERRGYLSFDQAFERNLRSAAADQPSAIFGREPGGKLEAYLVKVVKDSQSTNSQLRFNRVFTDGRLGPDQGATTPYDQPDGASLKMAEALFGGPNICTRLQVAAQPDGRILVVYGTECSRFPRPKLGRLFADGRLDVEAFETPNRFVSRRIPVFKADGLTPGGWYHLERSVGSEFSNWEERSYPFQAPPADQQPLKVRLYDTDHFGVVDLVTFWRLQQITGP